jgi:hypothetical protein
MKSVIFKVRKFFPYTYIIHNKYIIIQSLKLAIPLDTELRYTPHSIRVYLCIANKKYG